MQLLSTLYRLARWALALKARRGYHRTCVAIAAKNAASCWVLLARGETLRLSLSAARTSKPLRQAMIEATGQIGARRT